MSRPLFEISAEMLADIERLAGKGMRVNDILKKLGISIATFYRKKREQPAIREALKKGYNKYWGRDVEWFGRAPYCKIDREYWQTLETAGCINHELRKNIRFNKFLGMDNRRMAYCKELASYYTTEEHDAGMILEPEKPKKHDIREEFTAPRPGRLAPIQAEHKPRHLSPVTIPHLKRL
jgi:hypothetical protein